MAKFLYVVDQHPKPDSTGIYINDVAWAQFSEPLASGCVSDYTFTVNNRDTFMPVDGRVEVAGIWISGNYISNCIAKFIPTAGFDRDCRYSVLASTKIVNYSGTAFLDRDYVWYFETGSTASSGLIGESGLDPTGFLTSGSLRMGPWDPEGVDVQGHYLQVVSTSPSGYDSDLSLSLPYIAIKFNAPLPTGLNLYNYIRMTSKHVLQ